jgi:hypothetical protein
MHIYRHMFISIQIHKYVGDIVNVTSDSKRSGVFSTTFSTSSPGRLEDGKELSTSVITDGVCVSVL